MSDATAPEGASPPPESRHRALWRRHPRTLATVALGVCLLLAATPVAAATLDDEPNPSDGFVEATERNTIAGNLRAGAAQAPGEVSPPEAVAPSPTAPPTTAAPPPPPTTAPPTTAAPPPPPTTAAPPPPPTTAAPPPPPTTAPPPPPAPEPTTANAGVWDQLAQCESGGDWSANTGNGYYGGLQFSLSSWRSVGGTGYPNEASKSTQIARAEELKANGGWSHWPSCSRQLGLR